MTLLSKWRDKVTAREDSQLSQLSHKREKVELDPLPPPPLSLLSHARPCAKAAKAANARPDDMPAGAGVCPGCGRVRWLAAGAASICKDCEIDRLLTAAARAADAFDTCDSAGPSSTSRTDDAVPLAPIGAT